MQITILNGAVEYDGVAVLSNVNFEIHDKEKIALVGRNGCGKTTLFKALVGEVDLVKGTDEGNYGMFVTGKPVIGYLRQVAFSDENTTLLCEVMKAYADVVEIESKMEVALATMEKNSNPDTVRAYSDLAERFENEGGYTYKKEVLTAIRKFGFSDVEMQKPLTEFSGGQRTKIALLKLLLSRPDVLLLDEPTNHLDVEAIEWLENYLKDYKKSCVVVSHDRMFLDRATNVVYEIEYGETTRYRGNYTAFTLQKQEAYEKALKDAQLKYKEIERLTKIVERFRYKANKAAMAQAKLAQIKRLGTVDEPNRYDVRTFHAAFEPNEPSVKKTLVLDKLKFGYDKPLGEISMILERGSKLGIIGANGCGKSTLVHTIMHHIPALDGYAEFGLQSHVGYFDQTATQSASEHSVLEEFLNEFPSLSDTEARSALGAFMLSGDAVFKRVCDLSGGEKVRFALCRILKHRPNVLVLDEPTNHMDIVGKESFENLLKEFDGTIVVVSHDRYLINKICNRLVVFDKAKCRVFDCGFEAYEQMVADEKKSAELSAQSAKQSEQGKKSEKNKYSSSQRETDRKMHRIQVLEGKITALEEQVHAKEKELALPSIASDYKKVIALQSEIDALNAEIAPFEEEWSTLIDEV